MGFESGNGIKTNGASRRAFLKGIGLLGAGAVASAAFAGCAGGSAPSASASASGSGGDAAPGSAPASSQAAPRPSKSAVVFFSRAGENPDVGFVEEGNTAVVAHMIAGKIVSDVYEIVPVEPYPESYDECKAVALDELAAKARPAFEDAFADFDEYDTVYLGYPIWLDDMPMIVYSFLESRQWSGKTVAPFCTHGDSGLMGTVESLRASCEGATVLDGLAVKGSVAQNDGMQTDKAVNAWLAEVRS